MQMLIVDSQFKNSAFLNSAFPLVKIAPKFLYRHSRNLATDQP